jgi:hypothetical protein
MVKSIHTAKHTVDGEREASLEIIRPVCASGSRLWREFGDALDGRVGKPRENGAEVVAHRDLEPSSVSRLSARQYVKECCRWLVPDANCQSEEINSHATKYR